MLPDDDEPAARRAAIRFAEPRARHYWDGERRLAKQIARALGITARESIGVDGHEGFAWDVYLAYGPGKVDMERLDFWMHQLGVQHAPRLDPAVWREHVEQLLYE